MQIRLYMDEDSLSRALVRALHIRGVDVVTAEEAGMIEQDDEQHLAYATEQGRVLCSFNIRDFHQLHTVYLTQERSHAGMILAPQQRYSVGEQNATIVASNSS